MSSTTSELWPLKKFTLNNEVLFSFSRNVKGELTNQRTSLWEACYCFCGLWFPEIWSWVVHTLQLGSCWCKAAACIEPAYIYFLPGISNQFPTCSCLDPLSFFKWLQKKYSNDLRGIPHSTAFCVSILRSERKAFEPIIEGFCQSACRADSFSSWITYMILTIVLKHDDKIVVTQCRLF